MFMKKIIFISFLSFLLIPAIARADCRTDGCAAKEICEINSSGDYACVNVMTGDYGIGSDSTFSDIDINKSNDLKGTIANIINIVLGFLGIIAVILILAGGFKWMTAAGNEDQISSAKQMIIQATIGLVIIFAAWAIASFVITGLGNATA